MTALPAPHPRTTPCEDDPDLFDDGARQYEARRACRSCWNLNPCAARIIADERKGLLSPYVVGGMFARERTNLIEQRTGLHQSKRGAARGPRVPAECGTKQARRRHREKGEPCPICKPEVWTQQRRTQPLLPCGTPAAAVRHRRAGEPMCGPCRDAASAERKESTARRRRARQTQKGTAA